MSLIRFSRWIMCEQTGWNRSQRRNGLKYLIKTRTLRLKMMLKLRMLKLMSTQVSSRRVKKETTLVQTIDLTDSLIVEYNASHFDTLISEEITISTQLRCNRSFCEILFTFHPFFVLCVRFLCPVFHQSPIFFPYSIRKISFINKFVSLLWLFC